MYSKFINRIVKLVYKDGQKSNRAYLRYVRNRRFLNTRKPMVFSVSKKTEISENFIYLLTFNVSKMGKPSKEEDIMELFYNYPTKHWHFKEIKETVPIADNKISRWLKSFVHRSLIKKVKPKKRMPHYISNYTNPDYQNKKRLFALKKLYESGFLNHLSSLQAKSVILFGSLTRWDWHTNSDIDVFIYGSDADFEQGKYEKILDREIQVFTARNKKQLKKFNNELIKNIIKGDIIKGSLEFVEVKAHA